MARRVLDITSTKPDDGIRLNLQLRPGVPIRLRVVDYSDGLPDVPGVNEPRPSDTMPRFADTTVVGKSFDLTEPVGASGRNRPPENTKPTIQRDGPKRVR